MSNFSSIDIEDRKKLRCQRCKHIWFYRGANGYVACCPHCRTSVMVSKSEKMMEVNDPTAAEDLAKSPLVKSIKEKHNNITIIAEYEENRVEDWD